MNDKIGFKDLKWYLRWAFYLTVLQFIGLAVWILTAVFNIIRWGVFNG